MGVSVLKTTLCNCVCKLQSEATTYDINLTADIKNAKKENGQVPPPAFTILQDPFSFESSMQPFTQWPNFYAEIVGSTTIVERMTIILLAGLAACGVSVRSTVTALSTDDTDTAYNSSYRTCQMEQTKTKPATFSDNQQPYHTPQADHIQQYNSIRNDAVTKLTYNNGAAADFHINFLQKTIRLELNAQH